MSQTVYGKQYSRALPHRSSTGPTSQTPWAVLIQPMLSQLLGLVLRSLHWTTALSSAHRDLHSDSGSCDQHFWPCSDPTRLLVQFFGSWGTGHCLFSAWWMNSHLASRSLSTRQSPFSAPLCALSKREVHTLRKSSLHGNVPASCAVGFPAREGLAPQGQSLLPPPSSTYSPNSEQGS
jgi:hypothetical protein